MRGPKDHLLLSAAAVDTSGSSHLVGSGRIFGYEFGFVIERVQCCCEQMGATGYLSKITFGDATPELVRDFFRDDESRPKWDPMLAYLKILQECPQGLPYPALERQDKPRRVALYFSSWIVMPVGSKRGDGLLSACEVTLVHYEDSIPKDLARLGVRHRVWGTIKKLHSGFGAYQTANNSHLAVSRCVMMARISTKYHLMKVLVVWSECLVKKINMKLYPRLQKRWYRRGGGLNWRWVVIGRTGAVVCSLRLGVIGKALLLGAGQRFGWRGGNALDLVWSIQSRDIQFLEGGKGKETARIWCTISVSTKLQEFDAREVFRRWSLEL